MLNDDGQFLDVKMIVPEFSSNGSCMLVHNHDLQSPAAIELSTKFTQARVIHAKKHLPKNILKIEITFDCRGQNADKTIKNILNAKVLGAANVKLLGI